MFYFEKLRTIRQNFKNNLRGKKLYNMESNVYVFDESTQNLVGLNEQPYDSVIEESIAGQNITVGTLIMEKQAFKFEIALTEYIQEALQFNLIHANSRKTATLFDGIQNETIDFLSVAFGASGNSQLTPSVSVKHELYMRAPSTGFSSMFFVRVFEHNVWYAILGTIIASCLFLGLYKHFINKMVVNYMEMLYFTLGMSDVQNTTLMTVSLRVACFFTSLFMLLAMGAFSTFLTAELSVKEIHLPFHNLNEILQQTEYSLCLQPKTYIIMKMEEIGFLNKLNGGNCPKVEFEEYEFVESICNRSKTVYFGCDDDLYVEIVQLHDGYPPCDIYIFNDRYYPSYRAMPTKTTFKFKRQISKIITKLRTSGTLYHLYKKIIGRDKINVSGDENEDLTAIQFEHIKLMLIIYIIFMIIAFGILIIEVRVVRSK